VKQAKVKSPLEIVWPRAAAHDVNIAAECLLGLFPDHSPQLVAQDDVAWTFGLDWPSHLLTHTDPSLAACARTHYGLRLEELSGYVEVRRCGRADFVFSMFHSRALLAPALAAQRGQIPRTIVHVDAHSDLGPPLLVASDSGVLTNSEFGATCYISRPDDVMATIDLGLVHKGSFLAAYLVAIPGGSLFHVWDEAISGTDYLESKVSNATIGVQNVSCGSLVSTPQPHSRTWRREKLAALPQDLSSDLAGGVWLDVDLDAFCNRFDGDSDRQNWCGSQQEAECLNRRVSAFLLQLGAASWRGNIETVSVAASPGFFPAEYWEKTIPAVCDEIAAILSQ
jgi:hypothetical protein